MQSNELKHWGVLGMHWGVRKAYTDSTNRNQENAKKNRALAEQHRKSASDLHNTPWSEKKIGAGRKEHLHNVAAYRFTNRARHQETKAKRMTRIGSAIDSVSKKSYDPGKRARNQGYFKKAIEVIGIGTGAAISVALARPTADMFGKRIAVYVARKTASKVKDDIFKM